jgi:hypothetical protein
MAWQVWVGRAPFRPRTDLRSFTDLAEAQAYHRRLSRQGHGLVWLECDDSAANAARLMREASA